MWLAYDEITTITLEVRLNSVLIKDNRFLKLLSYICVCMISRPLKRK